jgi:hypothetical protein
VPAARSQDLLDAVTEFRPQVVHFSGHGGQNPPGLYFEANKGGPQVVSTRAIQQFFAAVGTQTKLVVLSACYSEDQARAIARHVDCVIGMGDAIADGAAIEFAVAIYAAIADNCSIRESFDGAKAVLAMNGHDDSIVKLFCRKGVDAAQVHLLPPQSASPQNPQ